MSLSLFFFSLSSVPSYLFCFLSSISLTYLYSISVLQTVPFAQIYSLSLSFSSLLIHRVFPLVPFFLSPFLGESWCVFNARSFFASIAFLHLFSPPFMSKPAFSAISHLLFVFLFVFLSFFFAFFLLTFLAPMFSCFYLTSSLSCSQSLPTLPILMYLWLSVLYHLVFLYRSSVFISCSATHLIANFNYWYSWFKQALVYHSNSFTLSFPLPDLRAFSRLCQRVRASVCPSQTSWISKKWHFRVENDKTEHEVEVQVRE